MTEIPEGPAMFLAGFAFGFLVQTIIVLFAFLGPKDKK